MFGAMPSFAVENVDSKDDKTAQSSVVIKGPEGSTYWVFNWAREWGDWRIDSFACVRGCG